MHPWNLTVDEAEVLQKSLAEDCVLKGDPSVETVAGIDMSMYPESQIGIAAVVLYSVSHQEILDEVLLLGDLTFPYVPGLLAFREAPLMLKALMKLNRDPDCLLVDGHGYAHPRRFGLASHLGLLMELPSIGCAKNNLVGEYDEPDETAGSFTDIWDGEPIGYAFRSRSDANPIFLSPGHMISRENMLPIVRSLMNGRTKLPRPLYRAHRNARNERRRLRRMSQPFREDDAGIFLVGGAVRDLLIGNQPEDYDLLVTDFPESIRTVLEDSFEASFFDLDASRNIYRLVAEELQLDVTVVDQDEVIDDLERRDFTINSIALDMNRENWVDPCNGRADIRQRTLSATTDRSIEEDPLRILRAYRLVTELDFDLTDELRSQILEACHRLGTVTRERIVEELLKITSRSDAPHCVRSMLDDGVLNRVSFFKPSGAIEVSHLQEWSDTLAGHPLLAGEYHGGYSLMHGIKAGRLIEESELDEWPFHRKISTVIKASYCRLAELPDFSVLNESASRLLGRLLGAALLNDWSVERVGEAVSRLQRYLDDRDLLEKDVVESLDEAMDLSERTDVGERKTERLRNELPGLWENRMAPILGVDVPVKAGEQQT